MTVRVAVLVAVTAVVCAGCGPDAAAPPPSPARTTTAESTEPDPYVPQPVVKSGVFTPGTECRVAGSPGITASGAPLVCRAGPDGALRWRSS